MKLRPEVRLFAAMMERKLQANEHKGGWQDDTALALLRRLREEADELERCLQVGMSAPTVAYEAADVANFAMMIADVVGGLLDEG